MKPALRRFRRYARLWCIILWPWSDGLLWSSTDAQDYYNLEAYYIYLNRDLDHVSYGTGSKNNDRSCRCIKDEWNRKFLYRKALYNRCFGSHHKAESRSFLKAYISLRIGITLPIFREYRSLAINHRNMSQPCGHFWSMDDLRVLFWFIDHFLEGTANETIFFRVNHHPNSFFSMNF